MGVPLVLLVDSVGEASEGRVGADRGRRLRVAYLTAADMTAG